jgi:hypothetical protein
MAAPAGSHSFPGDWFVAGVSGGELRRYEDVPTRR